MTGCHCVVLMVLIESCSPISALTQCISNRFRVLPILSLPLFRCGTFYSLPGVCTPNPLQLTPTRSKASGQQQKKMDQYHLHLQHLNGKARKIWLSNPRNRETDRTKSFGDSSDENRSQTRIRFRPYAPSSPGDARCACALRVSFSPFSFGVCVCVCVCVCV